MRKLSLIFRIAASAILLQTLFFKFSGAPESVYIFSTLGVEPWGRWFAGCSELVAAGLLLAPPTAALGALASVGIMLGAIGSHLGVLGIVVQDDGGTLFGLACATLFLSVAVAFLERQQFERYKRALIKRDVRGNIRIGVELNFGEVSMSVATGTGYERRVLHSVDAFEIVECHWEHGGFSPMHDHGWSRCAVLVQEGRFENTLDCGASVETVTYGVGETIVTPVGARHEARCVSEDGGRTLHVYTPRVQKSESPRFRSPSLEEVSRAVDLRLGSESVPWGDVETLLARVRENSVSTHSPLFMNQLFAGVTPHALAAAEAETLTKTTLATFEASPVLTSIELELVDRLGELAGWSPGAREGVGVPGGSSANFMAIHCARHFHDPESKAQGIRDTRYRIFVSREAHYSFRKACAVLGLGTAAVIPVDVDGRGRLSPQALALAIDQSAKRGETPLLACATAGTTVLGAFDPIDEIVDVCVDRKVWTHVDGAWGGPALFSERARSLMVGVDRADSIAIDAHKLLGAPLTSSFFLTRHREILQAANDVSGGDYLFHSDSVVQDRGRLSWQCGRGSSALGLWALWKNLGTSGIGNFVDELIELRHDVVSWIRTQPRLNLIHEPEWLNVCVRVVPPEGEGDKANWSRRVRESLRDEDVAFVNFSSDDGGSFLRLILAHPRLSLVSVQGILEAAQAVRA